MNMPRRLPFLENFRRRFGALSSAVAFAAAVVLAVRPPHAFALPAGGQLVAGQVTTTLAGTQLTLDQASRAAIMNWQSFNIAPNEFVRILQSGPDAAMLARVTGGDPSQLLGSLKADGKLFLINPKGIVVGQGAVIDTAAFLASTLDVADADFLKGGPLTFKGDSSAGVVNLGTITAREGNVLLLAHTVKNAGEIAAPNGTAGLGAGTEVYLAAPDAPMFVIRTNLTGLPTEAVAKVGVDNSGVITAVQARLEAAGGSIYDLAVNHTGAVQATGVEQRPDGRIFITAAGGTVQVSGTATARRADGSGGEILVGGDYQGKNPAVPNAARTVVTATALLDASAMQESGARSQESESRIQNPESKIPIANSEPQTPNPELSASGGRVIVWADGATRYAGNLSVRAGALGGDGGFAEVSGKKSLGFYGTADLKAPAGRAGTLLLDPDDVTIVAGAGAMPGGLTDRFWTESEDAGSHTLGADILTGLLATGSVFMQAANTITVDSPVTVAAGGTAGVSLTFAAPTVTLNQSVSLANVTNGELRLDNPAGTGSLTSVADAGVSASKVSVSGSPIVTLNGPVTTAELGYARSQGAATSLTATNPDNAISRFVLNTDPADAHPLDFTGNVAVHSSTALEALVMINSADNVTLSSAANLTIKDDGFKLSTITASGVTKLASTDGVLINEAGSDLLAGAGRRLLYTSTTAGGSGFDLGGLTGYTRFSGVNFPDDPQTGVSQVLYRADGLLTLTADAKTKTYGAADPTFTAFYTGGTVADLATLPTFAIQEGAHVNAGAYTIVPSGAVSAGYHDLAYANGTLTINPATLTYTANAASRTYGAANPTFGGTVTGFVNGDIQATATAGTLAFTTTATTSSNVGSYAIIGSGLTANNGNYTFTQAAGNATALTIDPATLTYVANAATRTTLQGNPAFSGTVTGFVNGDTQGSVTSGTLAFTTTATGSSPAGNYPITGSGLNLLNSNYVFAQAPANATAFSITSAGLLVITADSFTKTYGQADPVFTASYSGGTAANLTTLPSFSILQGAHTNAGTYTIVPAGAASSTHALSYQNGTLTINPATLLYAANAVSRTYGTANPAFSGAVTGFVAGDTLASATAGTLAFDTAATATSNVGSYAVTGSGLTANDGNYVFTQAAANTTALTISPATLSYVANAATRNTVQANPAFSGTVTGFVNNDTQATATTGTLAFTTTATASSPVGSYALIGSGLTALSGNYVFAQAAGNATAFAITLAPLLTITANDFAKSYGQPDPVFTASYAGGTAVNLTTLPSFSILQGAHANVGTYTIVPAGAASSTHALSYVNGTLRIDPVTLIYVANPVTRLYGDANPAFGGAVTGFVAGDTLASATTGTLVFTSSATVASNTDSYAILGGGLTANFGNYVFENAGANYSALTVKPAPLTLVGASVSSMYGEPHPLGFTVEGLRNGDSPTLLVGTSFSPTFPVTTNAGTYSYGFQNLGTTRNYEVTATRPGTLTVTPAPLTLAGNAYTTVFGDPLPTFGYTLTGLRNGDPASVLGGVTIGTSFFGNPAPGNYAFNFAFTGTAQNYQVISATPGTLTVTRRPITVTADNISVYAGVLPPLTATASGGPVLTSGPQFTLSGTTNATVNSPAGTYAITPVVVPGSLTTQAEVERFYTFTFTSGTLTLTQPPVEPTVTLNYTPPDLKVDANKLVKTEPTQSQVVVVRVDQPLPASTFSNIVRQTSDDIMSVIKKLVTAKLTPEQIEKGMLSEVTSFGFTKEEQQVFWDIAEGKMTMEQVAEGMATDPAIRSALTSIIQKGLVDAITEGRPLTPSQQLLANRMANQINSERAQLAATARAKYNEWSKSMEETIAKGSAVATFDLRLMPDIVSVVETGAMQDALVELVKAIRPASGAEAATFGGSVAAGGLAAGVTIALASKIFIPFTLKVAESGTILGTTSAVTMASWAAAGVSIAVTAGVLILTTAVTKVVESENNKATYQAYLAHNDQRVGDLAAFDLSVGTNQVEFAKAFAKSLGETFGTPK